MPLRNVATNYTFEQQRQEINLLAADVDTLDTSVTALQGLQATETSDSPTFTNLTLSGYLAGPATLTIDPAAVGDNTGTVVIAGNLQVDGTTTTINSTTMTVDDLNITLASGAANAAAANGAGLTVDGASATLLYNGTTDEWAFNKSLTSLSVSGTSTFSGQFNLGANMQFTAADPELEFNNGGPRFKVPAANTLSIHTGGGLGTTTSERLRITSGGTLESYSPDDTTPNIKFRSDDTNWYGALNQSTANGTITTFLSTGGDWDATSTTYNCTKALAQYPSTAIAVHNQYNSTWQSDIAFLSKAGGSTTTDGAVTELLRILGTGGLKVGNRIIYGSLASDPTGINAGDEYYNTTDNVKKVYDGSSWNDIGSGTAVLYTTRGLIFAWDAGKLTGYTDGATVSDGSNLAQGLDTTYTTGVTTITVNGGSFNYRTAAGGHFDSTTNSGRISITGSTIASQLDACSSITLTCWVQDDNSGRHLLMSRYGNGFPQQFNHVVDPNGNFHYNSSGANLGSGNRTPGAWSANTWFLSHVTYSPSDGVMRWYVNGTQVDTNTVGTNSGNGMQVSGGGVGFALMSRADRLEDLIGRMAMARIHNVQLTASEISAEWQAERSRFGV